MMIESSRCAWVSGAPKLPFLSFLFSSSYFANRNLLHVHDYPLDSPIGSTGFL